MRATVQIFQFSIFIFPFFHFCFIIKSSENENHCHEGREDKINYGSGRTPLLKLICWSMRRSQTMVPAVFKSGQDKTGHDKNCGFDLVTHVPLAPGIFLDLFTFFPIWPFPLFL